MPSDQDPDDVTSRFRRLIEFLGDRLARAHGWKVAVAGELGIHPSTLSKILSGERPITVDRAQRAAMRVNVDPAYFLPGRPRPNPADFFVDVRPYERSLKRELDDLGWAFGHGFGLSDLLAKVITLAMKRAQGVDVEGDWLLLRDGAENLTITRESRRLGELSDHRRDMFLVGVLHDFAGLTMAGEELRAQLLRLIEQVLAEGRRRENQGPSDQGPAGAEGASDRKEGT